MLSIELLGGFAARLVVDGDALMWPRKGALRLLQHLALAPGKRASLRALAPTCDDATGDSSGTRAVTDAVYALRRILEPNRAKRDTSAYVLVEADYVHLDERHVQTDVDVFETAVDVALADEGQGTDSLEHALVLYKGPLLESCSAQLEPLVAPMRAQLEQRFLAVARALAAKLSMSSECEKAIAVLHRALQVAPAEEEFHRQLIVLFGQLGRYHEAEQQLQECRRVLLQELALRPSSRTIEAIRQVRQQHAFGTIGTPGLGAPANGEQSPSGLSSPYFKPPSPVIALVGRSDDLGNLQRIYRSAHKPRLLTLCGLGGAGKTQLAIQLAHLTRVEFSNGVCFVDLSTITDWRGVEAQISESLSLPRSSASRAVAGLRDFLAEKSLLLILDNFEHVLDAALVVKELLAAASQLSVLCTSRIPLNVGGEVVVDVLPLPVKIAGGSTEPSPSEPSPAAQLFVQCAQNFAGFGTASSDIAHIEAICQSLDGIPLAIELAAARIPMIGVKALKREISLGLGALTNPRRDASTRQTSLEAVLKWTVGILSADSRRLLHYACLFHSGFSHRLLIDAELFDKARSDVAFRALLDAHIVVATAEVLPSMAQGDVGEKRFRILDTVRTFALRHSMLPPADLRSLDAAYVRQWCRFSTALFSARYSPHESELLCAFDQNFSSITQAVVRAATLDADLARTLVANLAHACVQRNRLTDIIDWLESLALLGDPINSDSVSAPQVRLHAAASDVYRSAANYAAALHHGQIAVCGAAMPGADPVASHVALAYAYLIQLETEPALAHATEALQCALQAADESGELDARILLTTQSNRTGRYREACDHGDHALALCKRRGIDPPFRLAGQMGLGYWLRGDVAAAVSLLVDAALAVEMCGNSRAEAILRLGMAHCLALNDEATRANCQLDRCELLIRTHKMTILEHVLYQQRGITSMAFGHWLVARQWLLRSMDCMPAGTFREQADVTLLWLQYVDMLDGEVESALGTALQVCSPTVVVRSYCVPPVLAACALLMLLYGELEGATWAKAESKRLRERDGIAPTVVESQIEGRLWRAPALQAVSPSTSLPPNLPLDPIEACRLFLGRVAVEAGVGAK